MFLPCFAPLGWLMRAGLAVDCPSWWYLFSAGWLCRVKSPIMYRMHWDQIRISPVLPAFNVVPQSPSPLPLSKSFSLSSLLVRHLHTSATQDCIALPTNTWEVNMRHLPPVLLSHLTNAGGWIFHSFISLFTGIRWTTLTRDRGWV